MIGLVLVFAVSIGGATTVLVLGTELFGEMRGTAEIERAEKTMTQLDGRASRVALGDAESTTVPLPAEDDGSVTVDEEAGWLRVEVSGEEAVNESLGAVVYERDGTTVAYQGGGVWRASDGGSVVVSSPEFHYRGDTLTLPLITVSGHSGSSDEVTVRAAADRRLTDAPSNPMVNETVNVTVGSEYYGAWGRFFEAQTDAEVTVDHDNRTATVTLVAPERRPPVCSPTSSTVLDVGFETDVDLLDSNDESVGSMTSYDSGEGPYAADGDASSFGLDTVIDVGLDSEAFLDLLFGGEYDCPNRTELVHAYGDTNAESFREADLDAEATVGEFERDGDGDSVSPLDALVADVNADARANGRAASGEVESGGIDGGTVRLEAGEYSLDRVEMDSGDRLVLDTSRGDVTLAVDESVHLRGNASVEVVGDGAARVYVEGRDDGDPDVLLEAADGRAPEVAVEGDRASGFWLYGGSNLSVRHNGTADDRARFVGVVYAPGGEDGNSSLVLTRAELFGGVVTARTTVGPESEIHYDEALADEPPVPVDAYPGGVSYLHLSRNPVTVE